MLSILKDAGRDESDFVAGSAIEQLARIDPNAALRILLSTSTEDQAQMLVDAVKNHRMPSTEKPYLLSQLWRLS